jgi:predicted phosphodiesterase
MINLVVGDVHATPDELEDCSKLMELVVDTAQKEKADIVTLTGDIYNTHDVVNLRTISFWTNWFSILKKQGLPVLVVRGNHDQVSPSEPYPHALLSHPDVMYSNNATSSFIPEVGSHVLSLPYFYDGAEFLANAQEAKTRFPSAHTLFCHQTFQGATYENGFFAKDAVNISEVPFDTVISGHIHSPQNVGKAIYVGAPRWRTRSDVNIDRHIYLYEHTPTKTTELKRISTGKACRRLWALEDKPVAPAVPSQSYDRTKDKLWIDVYGPDAEKVRAREVELKAQFGAITRGFPDRHQTAWVAESDGIDVAFQKYVDSFVAPYGTPTETLKNMIGGMLGK